MTKSSGLKKFKFVDKTNKATKRCVFVISFKLYYNY